MNKIAFSLIISAAVFSNAAMAAAPTKVAVKAKADTKVAAKANAQTKVAAKDDAAAKHAAAVQANKLFSDAVDLAQKNSYDLAIPKLQAAVNLQPNNAGYYNELGVALLSRGGNGDADAAVDALKKAVSLAPKHQSYFVNLGAAYNRKNDRADAIDAYRQALSLNPNDWQAHENLAVALYADQKLTEAKAEFNAAIANNPPQVHKAIAEKAIKDIDNYIALKEKSAADAAKQAADSTAGGAPTAGAEQTADVKITMPPQKREGSPQDDKTDAKQVINGVLQEKQAGSGEPAPAADTAPAAP